MSTTTIVEQRLPISIQLLSRISTYAHVFESVLAIVIFWLFPSLGPKMPERQITFRPRSRRYSESNNSVKSMASTLIDEDMIREEDSESDIDDDENIKVRRFYMLSTPLVKSKSLSLMPFARRMSLPTKRFSEHITTSMSSPFQSPAPSPFSSPLSTPAQTPSSILESACYFGPLGHRSEHVTFEEPEEMIDRIVEQTKEVEYLEAGLSVQPVTNLKNTENVTKMKLATRKAKSLLQLRRQS